jgi:DNA-binding SARP family transcriptional activator/outer membrane protein assembly factor BamB
VSGSVEVRLLGPLEVLIDGRSVELGAGTERALVAFLALHASTPVSTDSIIDALWGEQPPSTAREMVRTYVARVRKRLGDALQTRPGGYVLAAAADAIDAVAFERLCDEGIRRLEGGDPAASSEMLTRALGLWRGTPLPELDPLRVGGDVIARLEELRLSAIEARAGGELALGRAAGLVPELEMLVREHPYREPLRRELMLALYRCGRQADALERYREGRRVLAEDIGIEPSRDLQALHESILRQDPALDGPRPIRTQAPLETQRPMPAQVPTEPATRAAPHRQRKVLAGAVLAALVAAAVTTGVLANGGATDPQKVGHDALAVINPVSGVIVGSRTFRGVPGPIAVGPHSIWLGDGEGRSVLTLAASDLHVLGTANLGIFPYQIATNGAEAWAGNGFNGTLTRINAAGNATASFRPEPTSTGRLALAYGAGSLWIGSQDGALSQLDPNTGRIAAVIHGIGRPNAITVDARGVWIAEATRAALLRIDPTTGRITASVPIGGIPNAVAVGAGSVWAVTPEDGLVWRIDPDTNAVTASIDAGPEPSLVAVINGQVWIASSRGTLERVDVSQNIVTQTLHFDGPIGGLAGGHDRLWISVN